MNKRIEYAPEMIARWREMALDGQTMTAIAKAAAAELGHPVGPRVVVNRLTSNYPEEIAAIFAATSFSRPKADPDAPPSPHSHYGIKDAGHPATWNVLIADMPSLRHLVGLPYEEIAHAPMG